MDFAVGSGHLVTLQKIHDFSKTTFCRTAGPSLMAIEVVQRFNRANGFTHSWVLHSGAYMNFLSYHAIEVVQRFKVTRPRRVDRRIWHSGKWHVSSVMGMQYFRYAIKRGPFVTFCARSGSKHWKLRKVAYRFSILKNLPAPLRTS